MSKYQPLWEYVTESGENTLKLNFSDIENILKAPIDHSFLTYKKELLPLGYKVEKISMKEKTVVFVKNK